MACIVSCPGITGSDRAAAIPNMLQHMAGEELVLVTNVMKLGLGAVCFSARDSFLALPPVVIQTQEADSLLTSTSGKKTCTSRPSYFIH